MTVQKCDLCGAECPAGSSAEAKFDFVADMRGLPVSTTASFRLMFWPRNGSNQHIEVYRDICTDCMQRHLKEFSAVLGRQRKK